MKPKLLLYCTKANPYLYKTDDTMIEKKFRDYHTQLNKAVLNGNCLNGKIVAECDFEVEEIYIGKSYGFPRNIEIVYTDSLRQPIYLSQKSCLKLEDICEYLNHKDGYAIHIKNLHIFDEPKKLTDYHCKTNKKDELCLNGGCGYKFFYKAPQNMMKVYDHWGKGDEYILISIKPQWLLKILNGDKSIEVRKKVLKEMLEL